MKHSFYSLVLLYLSTILILSSCSRKKEDVFSKIPHVVTADIQEGIEKHIKNESSKNNGYFVFKDNGKTYSFKLVRIHTEYLSNLGPRSHFACVDLVDTKGDIYDVDFFLSGDPGEMKVTKTILHKHNGRPFYTWRQKKDKTWERVSIKDAGNELLGIKSGTDKFKFSYLARVPEIKNSAKMWIPVAESDDFQDVKVANIDLPGKYREIRDRDFGNKILYVELDSSASGKPVEITYTVKRKEKSAYESKPGEPEKFLRANMLIPLSAKYKSIAERVVRSKQGELVRARALYDHVIDQMRYVKVGEGWGRGDAAFACDMGTGNCTDYHSYFIALARAINIPARFAIGAAIPSSRDSGGISGYHCWVEFHADGKWWPIDISEADNYSNLATYYFGHHPANRIELNRGRDLVVEPGPLFGPINFLAYPYFERDGKPAKVETRFSFKRI